jgi:dihydroflavonol-4-reductase
MSGAVFVTGGSGFVGRAVVTRLVARGHPVRARPLSHAAAETLTALGAEPVRGDVLDARALAAAMRGCDVVYHVAGVNALCPRDPSRLLLVNVEGTRRVLRAAVEAGVRRLVHTSSAATLGEPHGAVGSEETRHRGWFLSTYERSKYEAEREALAGSRPSGLDVVSVNPASVQGPGRVGGTARLLLRYLNANVHPVVDSRLSVVDADDCAEGHVLAEERGRPGERYVLSGATLTVTEAVRLLGRIAGFEPRLLGVPVSVALGVAAVTEAAFTLARRRPAVCRELVRTVAHGHAYDGSRAARELGLTYTPLEETLRRTVAWYVEHGLVHRRRRPR